MSLLSYRCFEQLDPDLYILFNRDAASNSIFVDNTVRPPHNPTFTSNVQGLLRTKVEGGRLCHRSQFNLQYAVSDYLLICRLVDKKE